MSKPLVETMKDIIILLALNGNTNEYQTKKKLLNEEEKLALHKLKAWKARNTHNIFKQHKTKPQDMISLCGSTTSSSNTQFFNLYDDDIEINENNDVENIDNNDVKYDEKYIELEINENNMDVKSNDIDITVEESLEIESNNTEPLKRKKLNKSQRKQRRLNQLNLELN